MMRIAESMNRMGTKMATLHELNVEEVDAVTGAVVATGTVSRIGFDPNTGRIVEYDQNGNVINDDPTVWY